jgi:hypothetical protein
MRMSRGSREMPTLGRLIANPTGVEGFTFVRSAHVVWEEADSKQHRHHVDRRRLQLSAAIAVRKLGGCGTCGFESPCTSMIPRPDVMEEAGQWPSNPLLTLALTHTCDYIHARARAIFSRVDGSRLRPAAPLK